MKHSTNRLAALLAVLAIALASCGGSSTGAAALPVNDGDEPPLAVGACLEGEPECNDTVLPDAGDLPPPDDGVVSDGMVVDGGLSVSDALASDATGVVAVQGFLFDDGSGPVLCDALAESFPPQCGADSLAVSGHEQSIDAPLINEQGVTWTDQVVVVFGEIVDGTLVVDTTVTG